MGVDFQAKLEFQGNTYVSKAFSQLTPSKGQGSAVVASFIVENKEISARVKLLWWGVLDPAIKQPEPNKKDAPSFRMWKPKKPATKEPGQGKLKGFNARAAAIASLTTAINAKNELLQDCQLNSNMYACIHALAPTNQIHLK